MHLEGTKPTTLESKGIDSPWAFVCAAPCDRDVPLDATYRVAGPGVQPSDPFQLQTGDGGELTLRAAATSRAAWSARTPLKIAGVGSLIVGLTTALAAGMYYDLSGYGANDSPNGVAGNSAPPWVGPVAYAGLGVAVAGAVAWAVSAWIEPTRVDQHGPSSARPPFPYRSRFLPGPGSGSERLSGAPLLPTATTSPLFSVSF